MCGTNNSTYSSFGMMAPPQRVLRRNISSSSSFAQNNDQGAQKEEDAGRMPHSDVHWDALDCSLLSPAFTSNSVLPSPATNVAVSPGSSQLLLGTSAGLFLVDLQAHHMQLLGLQDGTVGHISYHDGLFLASCPIMDGLSTCHEQQQFAAETAGLYCVKVGNSAPSSPFDQQGPAQVTKLWHGNARCSAFAAPAAAADSQSASTGCPVPRIYLGTQPADLLYSDDMGLSWSSTGMAAVPEAQQWYHRLPPYEPAVRSISSSWSSSSASSGCSLQEDQQVLIGVEVGGAMIHTPSNKTAAGAAAGGLPAFVESSQGLCRDIQALQQDPFSSSRLYAVAGSGSLPGGLYRSRGKGQKWKRMFGYRYSVGMALSPYQKGRLVLVSADKPPEIGFNLFESTDGGRHWTNITDDVADAVMNLTGCASGVLEHAPVVMFVPGGIVVGCVTGHVFMGQAQPGGGYSSWELVAELPAAVHCMCLGDEAAAPASIARY